MTTQQQPPAPLFATLLKEEEYRHAAAMARLQRCQRHIEQLDKLRPALQQRGLDVTPTAGGLVHLDKAKALAVHAAGGSVGTGRDHPLLLALLDMGAKVVRVHNYPTWSHVAVRMGRLHLWLGDLPANVLPEQDEAQGATA